MVVTNEKTELVDPILMKELSLYELHEVDLNRESFFSDALCWLNVWSSHVKKGGIVS